MSRRPRPRSPQPLPPAAAPDPPRAEPPKASLANPPNPPAPPRPSPEEAERVERASQSFWTFAVSIPAILSVMRLVVETGGELQTTLLLVANVNPINLVAAFLVTGTRLVSALLIMVFAISAILDATVPALNPPLAAKLRSSLIVRWKKAAPTWFVWLVVAIAVFTWEALYLPWLIPALVAMYQKRPRDLHPRPVVRYVLLAVGFVGYGLLLGPTLAEAVRAGEVLVLFLLAAPPLLAIVIAGPLAPRPADWLARGVWLVAVFTMLWAGWAMVNTPVLPLTVTTAELPPEPGRDPTDTLTEIRGHVIVTNDVHQVILQERGGVRYLPVESIRSQILCPSEANLPRYQLRIRVIGTQVEGIHLENSILEAIGRAKRPAPALGAACRVAERDEPGWLR